MKAGALKQVLKPDWRQNCNTLLHNRLSTAQPTKTTGDRLSAGAELITTVVEIRGFQAMTRRVRLLGTFPRIFPIPPMLKVHPKRRRALGLAFQPLLGLGDQLLLGLKRKLAQQHPGAKEDKIGV